MAGTRLKQKLTAIADSIRIKLPSTALMTLDQMPPNIEDIVTHEIEDAIFEGTLTGTYINDRITTVTTNGFRGQQALSRVIVNNVLTIQNSAFYSMASLEYVEINKATNLSNNVFYGNRNIIYMNMPKVVYLGSQTFYNCSNFELLNFYDPERTQYPTLLNINAFQGTKIAAGNGYIVINDAIVSDMQADTVWSGIANQIIGNTQAASLGLIAGSSSESATVPTPATLQTIPINRLDTDEINIDPDLDLDLDLENERN